jgi:hypothetical protein
VDDALTARALQEWATDGETRAVQAAVQLVLDEGWHSRQSFYNQCTAHREGRLVIDWNAVQRFLDGDQVSHGSTPGRILYIAWLLATDELGLSHMGDVHARWIVDAFAQAMKVDLGQ